MKFHLGLIPLLLASGVFSKECYVTPCTRDVLIAVDNSQTMQNTENVAQQIDFVSSLTNGWTLSKDAVRVAVFGYLFLENYDFSGYQTNTADLANTYGSLKYKSQLQGVFPGNLSEYMWILDKYYVKGNAYPIRNDVMKRIVILTSETQSSSIAAAAPYSLSISKAGYQLTIISLAAPQSEFRAFHYHKFYSIPLASLSSVSSATRQDIIDNAICFWDAGVPPTTPQLCTTAAPTTTSKATTKAVKVPSTQAPPPTHAPIHTEADYLNCSCLPDSVWIDVVFAIDTSLSMGDDGLTQIKGDITSLVGQMTIDPSVKRSLRVGLVTFAKNGKLEAGLDRFTDLNEFFDVLWSLPSTTEEAINIKSALKLSETVLLGAGSRTGVPRVIVIYSSAFSDTGLNDPVKVSGQLKESGIQIITVAYVEEDESGIVLKLGELASPRMNFTSYRNDELLDQLIDGFCQCNCYCPNEWSQLVIQDRKFGECYFLTELDADWIAASHECKRLGGEDGMLMYINSKEKEDLVREYADGKLQGDNLKFHIGLTYNTTLKKYIWDTVGVVDSLYVNWDTDYPDVSKGNCVNSFAKGFGMKWQNENCATSNMKAMCMSLTCDTQNYCGP